MVLNLFLCFEPTVALITVIYFQHCCMVLNTVVVLSSPTSMNMHSDMLGLTITVLVLNIALVTAVITNCAMFLYIFIYIHCKEQIHCLRLPISRA